MVTNQEAIDKWNHDDNLAQHYLFNTCNEEQQRSLLTCTSAHAIWLSLTSRYQQNTAERRLSLGQELLNYKLRPDNGVRAHIEAIKLLTQQFKEAGGTMNEEDTQSRIINSLPPSYDSFITSWESVTIAERTFDTLTTRLMRQEEKMNLRSRGERIHEDKAPVHFKSLPRGNNRPGPYALRNRNRFGGRNNKSGRCSYCQIFGHSEENFLHKNSGSLPCNFCKIFGHQEDDCYRKQRNPPAIKSKSGDTGYAAGFSCATRSRTDFFLDSTASSHMTDQISILKNFTSFTPGSKWINGIGQAHVSVLGQGNLDIETSVNGVSRHLTIHNVLYDPGIGINLFSVYAFAGNGIDIHFTDSNAFIEQNGVLEMTASRLEKDLYHLDILILSEDNAYVTR